MLPPVKPEPFAVRRQPSEAADVDVSIVARDVDVGVMVDVVLPVPVMRTPTDYVQRHRHDFVDPIVVRICAMAAVVLNIETDRRRDQSEPHRQRQRLPPRFGHEDQQHVGGYEAREKDSGLQVHLRTVTLPTPSASEVLIYPSANLHLKPAIADEF